MKSLLLAFKTFFRTLLDAGFRQQAEQLLLGPAAAAPTPKPEPKPAAPPAPKRSEALTLLAALQREARLVDFLMEPIDGYADAQVGAAVRDIHRDCRAVLQRLFAPAPLREEPEGSQVEVPAGFDAALWSLIGNVSGEPPHRGALTHPGWQATRCELPEWSGNAAAANIVAPAEVEL